MTTRPTRGVATPDPSMAVSRICHMLVLKRDGKVSAAAQSLVIAVLAADPALNPRGVEDFEEAVAVYFNLRIERRILQAAIQAHLDAGRLLTDENGLIRPSLAEAAEIQTQVESASRLERQVREEWLAALPTNLQSLGAQHGAALWQALRAYLAKAFLRHGAQTVLLLQPAGSTLDPLGSHLHSELDQILTQYLPQVPTDEARAALSSFLVGPTAARSTYLAQLLDGSFTIFALTVDDATSQYLQQTLSSLRLFLDTNLIFGILDLHVNPADEAAKELVHLIALNDLPFTLTYHLATQTELRAAIASAVDRLRDKKWQQALSRAVVVATEQHSIVSGIERRYHEANAQRPTDVNLFVQRYESVDSLLAEQGAKLYRPPPDPTYDTERKGLEIAEFQAYLDSRPRLRRRPYRAVDHDVVLLHEVNRLCDKHGGSVLESGTLLVTQDFTLYEYAWRQARERGRRSPVVLASQLVQLLRPFVEPTEEFDRFFVETFALPELRAFPVDYRETAGNVVAALNAITGIPEGSAIRILTSDLLMTETRGFAVDSAEFAARLDEALLQDNAELIQERDQARQARETLLDNIASQEKRIEELEAKVQTASAPASTPHSPEGQPRQSPFWRLTSGMLAAITGILLALLGIASTAGLGWVGSHNRYFGAIVGGWVGIVWFAFDSSERRRWSGAIVIVAAVLGALA